MALSKLALVCALLASGQGSNELKYTNIRSGRIQPDIAPDRVAEIRELQLFISPDKGKTWNQADKITPDKDSFSYFVPNDGEYWYQVVIVDQKGRQEPADLYKAPPMMKLMVDTRPPDLKITSAQRQGDELVVSWSVREDNPDPPRLKLEYRPADSVIWTPMPLTPSPNGSARAKLSTSAPVVVRLQFKDLANNAAETEQQVTGGVAAAGFNPTGQAPKGPEPVRQDVPLPPPPNVQSAPAPPPPVYQAAAMPEQPSTGSVVGVQQPPTVARVNAIASSNNPNPAPAAQPQLPSGAPQRAMPDLQVVNDPEIVVEYEVSKVGPSGLGKIEVWITRDGGANWSRYAEDLDAAQATSGNKYKRTLMLPGEGVYGISLVVRSKAGLGKAQPRSGDLPEMVVEVDTTPPVADLLELLPDPQRRDTVILSWTARDRNVGSAPVTVEWSERPSGPWQVIATGLPNAPGRYPWQLPSNLPAHVYLKLTVRDTAGNISVAVTRDPQLVDLSEPEGRLLRVMPANKK